MTNHYRTLGVDPDAEEVVIRSAYLALIRRYHPDKGGDEADGRRAQAITAAWEVLRDPERRAAYDMARTARFRPDGGAAAMAGAPYEPEAKIRGGTAGRNLFLLLAAGTIGLGWWASTQPLGRPAPVVSAPVTTGPAAEPVILPEPVAEEEAEPADLPPLPPVAEEPDIDVPVTLPPLPAAEPARMPVKVAARPAPPRAEPRPVANAPERRPAAVKAAPAREAGTGVDLAPLERHLQLLTDQSIRYGDSKRRARLFSSGETFQKRLSACRSDSCRRDAYLRRNQEVAEIMRR